MCEDTAVLRVTEKTIVCSWKRLLLFPNPPTLPQRESRQAVTVLVSCSSVKQLYPK